MPRRPQTPAMPDSLYVYCTAIVSQSNSFREQSQIIFSLFSVSHSDHGVRLLDRRPGLAASFVCAGVAPAIHRMDLPPSRSRLAFRNALAWLAVYVFFAYVISEIRHLYARERTGRS
jgi:hypothetical protein